MKGRNITEEDGSQGNMEGREYKRRNSTKHGKYGREYGEEI
jgi:hypothetical protein